MITVYKNNAIPKGMEKILFNDVYFNMNTADMLDDRAEDIIYRIDSSKMLSKYTISSRFDNTVLRTDKLSTGCKTVLNVLYNPEKVFDVRECGDNALSEVYKLEEGNICCDYPFIAFDVEKVRVCDKRGYKEISDYEELKRWWLDEN